MMLNNPTSKQNLASDPWLTSEFRTKWWNVAGGSKRVSAMSKVELYSLAKTLGISGRSKMDKASLLVAVMSHKRKKM